jgi:hypothetical protein
MFYIGLLPLSLLQFPFSNFIKVFYPIEFTADDLGLTETPSSLSPVCLINSASSRHGRLDLGFIAIE